MKDENVSSEGNDYSTTTPKINVLHQRLSIMSPEDDEQEESVRFAKFSPKLEQVYAPYSCRNQPNPTRAS